jgi:hypothetical protein
MNTITKNTESNAAAMAFVSGVKRQLLVTQETKRTTVFYVFFSFMLALSFTYSNVVSGGEDTVAASNDNGQEITTKKITKRLQEAEAAYTHIKSVGFAWTTMKPLLDDARSALDNNKTALSSNSLLKLENQIKQAAIQYKNSQTVLDD